MENESEIEFTLSYPVRNFGDEIFTVTINTDIRGKQLKKIMAQIPQDQLFKTIEITCGLEPSAIEEMTASDILTLEEILTPFLSPHKRT